MYEREIERDNDKGNMKGKFQDPPSKNDASELLGGGRGWERGLVSNGRKREIEGKRER